MGLDITAHETLVLVRKCSVERFRDEEIDDPELECLYATKHFLAATDGMAGGVYRSTGKTSGFGAGSYGGYGEWRQQLARLVGTTAESVWADPKPGPFVELINNSDCEGFIGPVTSKKLAADFAAHQEAAKKVGDQWFFARYLDWKRAFELAANGGAVVLH